ncbi:outer membrane beta-barrel protein [Marinobacter halotolerans]|uniref:outer membrane beta-barrel protein n=1 Tax=Marinobacter halotolerans TaxID=1569211 RepID=UPI001244E4D0|nr:outer membrane beta-barrel protein [Marinobacter halotolerans]
MDRSIGAGTLRRRLTVLLAGLLILAPLSTHAQLRISGNQSARFTDNAAKTPTNEQSDLESTTSLTAVYESDPGRCNATFSGTVGYSIWLDESFDNETNANMNLNSECELSPGFYWDLDNNLREVRQDSTQSDTPANRTRKNVFSTGPRYVWRLGTLDTVTFSSRYEDTEFEEPEETDSERYVGQVAWSHLFSPTLTGGVSGSYTSTELDTGAEVNVQTVRLTSSKQWATTSFSGSIGVSEIETEVGNVSQKSDGLVGQLELTRTLNPSTRWYIRASRELTDRTSDIDIQFGEFDFGFNESISVETTTVATGLTKSFSDQGNLNIEVFANQSDQLESDQLEEQVGLNLGYSRPITGRLSGNARLGYRYLTFEENQSDDATANVRVGLSYQASRELSFSGQLGHERKTSDVSSREYDESFVLISVGYRFR